MSVNEVEKEAEVRRLVTRFASAAEPDYSRRNPFHDFRLQLLHVILDLAFFGQKVQNRSGSRETPAFGRRPESRPFVFIILYSFQNFLKLLDKRKGVVFQDFLN